MTFTPEQLVERRKYLGASEAGAALGMSPFWTPVELYLSKIGEGEPIETTIPMMVGTALEPVTLQIFERETHLKVELHQQVFVDETCPWRRCTVDGWVHSEKAIVEAKTSGDFRGWGDAEDDIPVHYLYNLAHSFACIPDAQMAYVPVLVGGRTYETYRVKRDPELVDLVKAGEEAFMDLVKARQPPPPMNRDDVKLLYPKSNGMTVYASEEVEDMVRRHAIAKAKGKAADKEADDLATAICYYMKSAGTLQRMTLLSGVAEPGAVLATWNSQTERRIDPNALRAGWPQIAAQVTTESSLRKFLNKFKVQA